MIVFQPQQWLHRIPYAASWALPVITLQAAEKAASVLPEASSREPSGSYKSSYMHTGTDTAHPQALLNLIRNRPSHSKPCTPHKSKLINKLLSRGYTTPDKRV
jgi:hypothetical protein